MEFLLSPWFGGLSALSIIMMLLIIWGARRSCKRHNASPLGFLCGKKNAFPCAGTYIVAGLYVVLTFAYVFAPPIIHDLLL